MNLEAPADLFPPNYWLVASAQSFLLPVAFAYQAEIYPTAGIYMCLWATSIYFHSTKSLLSFYLDQLAVVSAVTCSFVDGYATYPYGILCTLAGNGYNYYVFVHAKHCSSQDMVTRTVAHAGIHIFSSIAATLQMILYLNEPAVASVSG
jgi:hypothetical protein